MTHLSGIIDGLRRPTMRLGRWTLISIAAVSCHRPPSLGVGAVYPVMTFESGALATRQLSSARYVERTLSRAATGDTSERESVVSTIDEIVPTGDDSTLVRVTTGHYAGGDYYDSLFVRRADLRPVRERLAYLQSQKDDRFTYEGDRVRHMSTVRDSTANVDRRYAMPVFAFSEIELIIRSLPYHSGYTAILPLYSEGDAALEMDSVAVVGESADRWTIRFADPAVVATYGVDAATRRIVSYDVIGRKSKGKARKVYQDPPPSGVAERYELVHVADGVYTFVAPVAYGGLVNGNTTVVIGDSAVLMLDPGHFPALTRRMLADVRRLTDRPIRYVVNSHWHTDHWLANGEVRAAFPNVEIISTAFTRDEMIKEWPTARQTYVDTALGTKIRAFLAKHPPPDLVSYQEETLADLPGAERAWVGFREAYPTMTFNDSLTVHLGGRDVDVLFLGSGNTAGDAVVYVRDSRVVATGDLVVFPVPYAYAPAHPRTWIETLGRLTSLGATTYIPGHGPIERDTTYIHLIAAALASVDSQVRAAVQRGLDLNATKAAVDLKAFEQRFTGGDPRLVALFHIGFESQAVTQAFADATTPSRQSSRKPHGG